MLDKRYEIDGIILNHDDFIRFVEKIDVRGDDECWYWNGANNSGYGAFALRTGVVVRANRLSLSFSGIKVKSSDFVLHSTECTKNAIKNFGNPKLAAFCCNPNHLRVGTQKENAKDRKIVGMERGLFKKGHKSFITNQKLSKENILAIRADRRTQGEIAKSFGINQSTVSRIKRFQRWEDV